jgi:uncharacterized protein (UPF0548 family)
MYMSISALRNMGRNSSTAEWQITSISRTKVRAQGSSAALRVKDRVMEGLEGFRAENRLVLLSRKPHSAIRLANDYS